VVQLRREQALALPIGGPPFCVTEPNNRLNRFMLGGCQRSDGFEQFGAQCARAHRHALVRLFCAVNNKPPLCQIDANGYDCHGLLLPTGERVDVRGTLAKWDFLSILRPHEATLHLALGD
jgi:hypothetical protein